MEFLKRPITRLQIGAVSLFIGASFNLTRLFPIFLNNDSFPPETSDELTSMTLNNGWLMSHIMGFISAPLVIIGIITLYEMLKSRNQKTISKYATVFITLGMVLYGIAVGVDGLLLPQASKVLRDASTETYNLALMIQSNVHSLALMFGSLSLISNLLGAVSLGTSLIKDLSKTVIGTLGIVYGVLGVVLLQVGVIDIFMHNNFELGAGAIFMIHLWFIPISIIMYRHSSRNNSNY